MNAFQKDRNQSKNKKRLSKNQSIKLYKEKRSKILQFQQEVQALKQKYNEIDSQAIQKFDDFPLSERTSKGLKKAGYINPTDIQKDSIGLALNGHDILGAAKTGSGKTLAFIIPMLESLYCAGWTILDGLGALVITPTRELAYQIFEVLNKVGAFHSLSAALVIGGKDLAKELKALNKCNILICTPGRLLQHLDENSLFDVSNLRMLVLDEADRILDLGFAKTLNAILDHLPIERQTLLFSATQTRSVKDLARLSLKDPVYISAHEHAKYSTPENLSQNYMICEAHNKMNLLWSFIKSHKQKKILVFVATCKQVKFLQESIIRLKPHVEIMALHGRLHQLRRMQIYDEFCRKNYVVLIATDVAARGLDFPNVDWVVQLDCPEDANTYIHRAGRTARYKENGCSLLVLLPSEKPSMIEQLKQRKIPIEEQIVNQNRIYDVHRKLEAILARDANLKQSARRAYRSYIKNVAIMKDKTIFDVNKIDFKKYARSLGLTEDPPRLRFLKNFKIGTGVSKNSYRGSGNESDDNDLLKLNEASQSPKLKSAPCSRSLKKINTETETSKNYFFNHGSASESDDDDMYLTLKGASEPSKFTSAPSSHSFKNINIETDAPKNSFVNHRSASESDDDDLLKSKATSESHKLVEQKVNEPKKLLTKAAAAKQILKKKIKANTIMKFDDEGKPIREICGTTVPVVTSELQNQILQYNIEKARQIKEQEEEADKIIFREKVKQKHREERLKLRTQRKKELGNATQLADTANDKDRDSESENEIDPNDMLSQSNADDSDAESYDDTQTQTTSEAEQSDDESEVKLEKSKKRKKNSIHRDVKRHKKDQSTTNYRHSLDVEEDLALHFLTNT